MHTGLRGRTRRQRAVEAQHDGKPLGDVIDDYLYRRNLNVADAAGKLDVDPATLWRWVRELESRPTTNGAVPATNGTASAPREGATA